MEIRKIIMGTGMTSHTSKPAVKIQGVIPGQGSRTKETKMMVTEMVQTAEMGGEMIMPMAVMVTVIRVFSLPFSSRLRRATPSCV
jgi:hypothetical protein